MRIKSPAPYLATATCLASVFSLSVHASSGFALTPSRIAAVDTSRWNCRFCPDAETSRAEIELQLRQSDDQASTSFRNTRGSDGETQADVSGRYQRRDSGSHSSASVSELGNDNASIQAAYKNQGGTHLALDARQRERYDAHAARTPFVQQDPATLDSAWVPQASTATMDFSGARTVESYRQRGEVSAYVAQTLAQEGVQLSARYRHLKREGTRWERGSVLNNVSAFSTEQEDVTEELTLALALPFSFVKDDAGELGLQFFQSDYDNQQQDLRWQNPFLPAIPGAVSGQRAAAPDNRFRSWLLHGRYRFGAHLWSASWAEGKGEQTEALLPYTVNTALLVPALPVARFEGEVDTRQLRLGWDYPLNSVLDVHARWRLSERDNQSEQYVWTPVMTDSLLQGSVMNELSSHQRNTLALGFDWRPHPGRHFDYVGEYERFERDRESSAASDMLTLTLGWRERWTRELTTRLSLTGSERREDADGQVKAPGQNPYFDDLTVSDRERNKLSYAVHWQASRELSLRTELALQRDRYPATEVGVTDSLDRLLGAQLVWQANEQITGTLGFQRTRMDWHMAGSAANSVATWDSAQEDEFDALTLGLQYQGLWDKKLDLGAEYMRLNGQGLTQVNSSDYQPLKTDGHTLKAWADYHWREQWTLRFEALYERYQSHNPYLLDLATLPQIIGRGERDENYSEWLFGLRLKYAFIP